MPTFCFWGRRVHAQEAVDRVRPLADRVARSHGLEVFDLKFRRESIGWVLRVVIDHPPATDASGAVVVEPFEASIGIDDCQRVSHDLGALLDVDGALDEVHYTLEVSSPGADRPLRGETDFRRFAGRLAKIVVREAVDSQMHFEGRLQGVDGGAVVLEVGRGTRRLPLDVIARARLEVEF